jgi:hypothetical protein
LGLRELRGQAKLYLKANMAKPSAGFPRTPYTRSPVWPVQGLGYAPGFTGEAAGVLVQGVGQAVDSAVEGVGEVVDAIGDAAEDARDEVTSWF